MPNNIRNLGEAIVARRRPNPLRERIIAKAPIEQKTVKSAGRVLEILEYFDDLQRQSTVMEIADALGYPQSSTSALLRSLVGMGYLNYDAHARTYITSKIGRASCRERVCQYVYISVGAVSLKKKNEHTH